MAIELPTTHCPLCGERASVGVLTHSDGWIQTSAVCMKPPTEIEGGRLKPGHHWSRYAMQGKQEGEV